jgi:signal transduction histidine kinase
VTRIRDNGRGIPPDKREKIFEPFLQLDQSLERAESGLGIGLTLVRRIIELHGGTITASSAGLGHGSEFMVRLPLLKEG